MKRKFTILATAFALLAFLTIPMGMWGQTRTEVVAYTLDGTQTGGSNGYATESEITQDGITWMVTANTDINPWRFGGKSLNGIDRPMYSTNQIVDNVTKVVITNGTTNLTVNSMTLIVSADADFSNPTSTITGEWAASATTTFERPAGADWTNKYYKLVYNLTTTSTSNKYAQFVTADFYKELDASAPSINAEDVEIAYDAMSGSIAYSIDNPAGGSLTVNTTSDWLALGTVGTTSVPFTCTVNPTAVERSATVTLTYTYNTDQTIAKNITVTQTANPNAIDNISDITATGTYTVQGTIVAKSQRGFIVGDGTGYVYYYNTNYTQSDYNIGDMVKLAGPVVVYGGVYEFNNSTTITTATSSNYVAEDPTVLTGEQMDARVASTTPPQLSSYVQYEGTFSINDTHYNITDIVGATTAIGSVSYPLNVDEITALDGKYVKVTGYYVGISTSTYYNTMLGSIEEIASSNPSITAENVSIEYNTTSGAIAYTIDNPVDGGTLTAATESEWLILGTVGTTVPFTCVANTTASPRTATVTLTYTYNTDQIVTKNVTVTQAGNPNTIGNISDITAAGTYTVQGTIVAISNRGFILGDGTGYVYYYYGAEFESGDYDIGDIVKLSGPVVVYGGVFEFDSNTSITYVEESNYVEEEPTVLSGADMDARVASTTPAQLSSYVQYEGTFTISGTHYNVTNITGTTTAIGSISYPLNADEIAALDGKQVKVTGYYVGISSSTYYNTMIGSIEEVEVQHEEYTLTVSNLVNVNTYVFDADDESEMLLEGEGSVQILDGTRVMISVDVEEGYVLESLMVDGVNVTSQIDETGAYTFTMPTHNVTISATAVEVTPFEPSTYTLVTSLDQIESGKTYLIVGSKEIEGETHYYAMGEQRSNNRGGYAISVVGTIATVETADVHEFVITALEEEGFYSIYDGGYLYAASSSGNQLKTKAELDVNGQWEISFDNTAHIVASNSSNRNVMQFNYGALNNPNPLFSCYALANQSPVYLYVKEEATTSITQTIVLTGDWNWVSLNVEGEPMDLLQQMEVALGDNGIQIESQYDGLTENIGDGYWMGDLQEVGVVNESMYLVQVAADCEIELQGEVADPADHVITLYPEWTWIGFPCTEEVDIMVALSGLEAEEGDMIEGPDGVAEHLGGGYWYGLETLVPGQGYMYYSLGTEEKPFVFRTVSEEKVRRIVGQTKPVRRPVKLTVKEVK